MLFSAAHSDVLATRRVHFVEPAAHASGGKGMSPRS
jgi:hypothetical protein